jgi:hypothetical protein
MNNRRSLDLIAIVALTVLWGVFFWRMLTPREVDQVSFAKGDFSGQYFAFAVYHYDRLASGEIPLWNPYNNSGFPFIGDTQSAVYYFPKWLTVLAGKLTDGWSYHLYELETMFHILVFTYAMYAFMRRLTKDHSASHLASFISTIAAGYGGYLTGYPTLQVQVLESGVWLPLCALGILEATRTSQLKPLGVVLAGFALGNSWLSGHPQTCWFLTYFCVAWLAYRGYEQGIAWRNIALGVVLMGVVTFGTTAVTFLPGLEYSLLSTRADLNFEGKGNGFPYQDLIQLVLPTLVSLFSPLYVGISTLGLVYVAIRHWQRQHTRFWLAILVIGILFSFGANSALYHALYQFLPGLSAFRGQERVAFLISIAVSVLAGYGVLAVYDARYLLKTPSRVLFAITGVLALVFGVAWMIDTARFGNVASVAWFSFLLAVLLVAWVEGASTVTNSIWMMGLAGILIFDLFSIFMFAPSNYALNPPDQQVSMTMPDKFNIVKDDLNAGNLFRVDGYRGLTDNYGTVYDIYDMRGISPLFLASANQIIYRNYVSNSMAWEVFGVKYIFSELEKFNSIESDVIATGEDDHGAYFLHQVRDPRPFALLMYQVVTANSDGEAVHLLSDSNFDRRNNIILNVPSPLELPTSAPDGGTATITQYQPETIKISVDAPTNAILSLSHIHYPGWYATIDGENTPILRAYGALSAIAVPQGTHEVVLRYDPMSFKLGFVISLVTWLGLGGWLLWGVWQSRNTSTSPVGQKA